MKLRKVLFLLVLAIAAVNGQDENADDVEVVDETVPSEPESDPIPEEAPVAEPEEEPAGKQILFSWVKILKEI